MPQPVCSTSSGSAKCSRASGGESSIRRWSGCRRSRFRCMLEIGRETVYGEAADALLAEAADELVKEAMGEVRGRNGGNERGRIRRDRRAIELAGERLDRRLRPARCIGRRNGCWWSPTCISKKVRALPRAACCCRPMTRRRRWRGSRRLIARYAPRAVIALGDSFHDGGGPQRLGDDDRDDARARCSAAATGSGSPAITIPIRRSGSAAVFAPNLSRSARSSSGMSRRGARRARSPAICIRWRASAGAGAAVSRRCFASDGERMVMPAFGAFTGGLNLRDRAFVECVRRAGVPRAYARRDAALRGRRQRIACRITVSPCRNTTDANQPVASAISDGEQAIQHAVIRARHSRRTARTRP